MVNIESLSRRKLSMSGLFTEIEEISLDHVMDRATLVFDSELCDIFITDGVLSRDRTAHVVLNASYIITGKPSVWEHGCVPSHYYVSLYLTPGTLESEEKIKEILEKAEFFRNTDNTLMKLPPLFAIK